MWHPTIKAAQLKLGQMESVSLNGQEVAIYNVNGSFYATEASCTHAYAPLTEGSLEKNIVECPLHGSRFDVKSGSVLGLPAVTPLKTYPTKVEEGTVYVDIS